MLFKVNLFLFKSRYQYQGRNNQFFYMKGIGGGTGRSLGFSFKNLLGYLDYEGVRSFYRIKESSTVADI